MRSLTPALFGLAVLIPALGRGAAEDDWADRYFFRRVRVTPDGQGDGRSWEQATSLQRLVGDAPGEAAILNARGGVPCDQLWLSRGEHCLSKRLYANRDFHVSILGGFTGTEASAEQRDPAANRTTVVLDGCQFLFTRWAHHLTIDGLTIRNGVADYGGAIHIAGSRGGGNSILIRNVEFVNCRARRDGGAIRVLHASKGWETRNLRIVDCRFIGCAASGVGGAITIDKTSKDDFDGVLIRGCEFRGNRSTGNKERDHGGGAVFVVAPNLRVRPVCIEYCLFGGNRCMASPGAGKKQGGDAIHATTSHLVVKHCDFAGGPDVLHIQGSGKHELEDNRFVATRGDVRRIHPDAERGPVWDGHGDPGDWCYRDVVVSAEDQRCGRPDGAQYELYQPSITYSMICEGVTPPLYGRYQHCAAIAHFDGKFFVVWQSNPTVHIEWARGRKIYFSTSTDFETWSAPQLVAPDLPHLGGTQPMLLSARDGELWCIWLCSARDREVHGLWLSTRASASGKWTHRRIFSEERLDHQYSLYPQSSPAVLSSGRIIAPFIARVGESRVPAGVFLYTDDDGATWQMSNWIRWPVNERNLGLWEICGSEQQDGAIRVFGRDLTWNRAKPGSLLLTAIGTGVAKGSPLRFGGEVECAGVQACQNRPQVFGLRGARSCLLFPDAFVDQSERQLPYWQASMYFSRSGRNDYVAGPALVPRGVHCTYPQAIEHDGSIYIACTGEYPDDWRNIVGIKVTPSPDPDRFYLWPRRRQLGPYTWSEPPEPAEVDGRRCVRFRGSGTAGVDIMPLDLAEGRRLDLRLDVKVLAASAENQSVLLSFGDMTPIRVGGPSLAEGKLSISTGTEWREAADFALDTWHRLSVEFAGAHVIIRVDDQAPRSFDARAGERNPRVYLGEGVIVGDFEPSPGFEFAIDLASLRTTVRQALEGH